MSKFKKIFAKLKKYTHFSNFTILVVAAFCSVISFLFAFACMANKSEQIKARIDGIIAGVACFLLIFSRFKRFSLTLRSIAYILLVATTLFIFGSITELFRMGIFDF
ncbi:MAG: hypothetical protein AMJ43_09690 [Coxiella sp. DG_40]|nr:MAG: hypothetical protein AMJ43_09690 [Coxiella sp. DG_40]